MDAAKRAAFTILYKCNVDVSQWEKLVGRSDRVYIVFYIQYKYVLLNYWIENK